MNAVITLFANRFPAFILMCLLAACGQDADEAKVAYDGQTLPASAPLGDRHFPQQSMTLVLPLESGDNEAELSLAYTDGLIPVSGAEAVLERQRGGEWTRTGRAQVLEVSAESIRLRVYEGGLQPPGRVSIQIEKPVHRCDAAASSPLDVRAVAPPVPFSRLPVEAVEYCSQAVSDYPDTPRFHFQLGRALDAHQQQSSAITRYRESLVLAPDYTAPMLALAGKYQVGQGVQQDLGIAEQLLEQANALGNPRAGYLLAQLWLEASPTDPQILSKALQLEHVAAEAGDVEAQGRLAVRYASGDRVDQDLSQSLHWHEQAAAQGAVLSQAALADAYAEGRGRPRDMPLARHWWSRAASQGHVPAQLSLALSLEEGEGMAEPDYAQSFYWYRRAAEAGDATGQYHLGRMYALGRGTDKDSAESEKWLKLALANGVKDARRWLPSKRQRRDVASTKEAVSVALSGTRLNQMRLFRVKTRGYMDATCKSALREEMRDLGLRDVDGSKASARLHIYMSQPVYYQSRFGPFTTSGYRIQYRGEVMRRGDNVRLFYTQGTEDGDDRSEACIDALDEIFDALDDARD